MIRIRNADQKQRRRSLNVESLEARELLTTVSFYDDALQAPWGNWSWETTADFSNAAPVRNGTASIAAQHNAAWAGLYFGPNSGGVSSVGFDELDFSIHGGPSGGQSIQLSIVDQNDIWIAATTVAPPTNAWTDVTVDLNQLGNITEIRGLVFQDASGGPGSTFYLDEVSITDTGIVVSDGPTITVDTNTVVRQINDDVYGLNFAESSFAAEIGLPVNRWGGNATTRYNYQLDATNLASDYFFENYPSATPDPATLPNDSTADIFVAENQQNGTDSIVTIGTIGWTPNSRDIQGSFPVDVYGPQQQVDPFRPNFGNGVATDGSFIVNDPSITSNPADEQLATDWIGHLTSRFGDAANGGVQYYALDNEPMLWNSTHRDVHPQAAGYDEVLDKGVSYAAAIKQADPTAQVLGPSVWGWTAYFYSALDAEPGGAWWTNPLDRNAHGGQEFLPWYLSEMAAAEAQTGTRLLDYLDIHYYPQSAGVALGGAGDAATQAERLRSTRSLWDPNYVDNSWINEEIQLIPRMRDWIDTHYPGTKLAITEYNWGGVEDINGAVTQADVLGILGREGVDLATMWDPPAPDEPTAFAFRMFRNYDGDQQADSRFGESSLLATSSDVDDVSVFASHRSVDGALTLMLINKSTSDLETPISIPGYADSSAEVYTYDATNLNQIVRASDLMLTDGTASLVLPGYSMTLIELPAESMGTIGDFNADGQINVTDIDLLCSATRSSSPASMFDLNTDGDVNSLDMDDMILNVVGTRYGDANLDFAVDGTDFQIWNANKFSQPDSWGAADFSCDGFTDGHDFLIWNANKFQPVADSFIFSVNRDDVPENLYFDEITLNADVCEGGIYSVTIDGASADYVDHGDGTISFNSHGTQHVVTSTVASCDGFGDVEIARLKDNLNWAYSHGFDDNVQLHAAMDEFEQRDLRATIFLIGEIFDDNRDEGWIVDLPEASRWRDAGFSIGGHGWSSQCDDANEAAVAQVMDHLQARLGTYQVTSFAAPCFVAEYHPAVLNLRDQGHRVQFNESGNNFQMDIDDFDFDSPVGRDWRFELGLDAIRSEIDSAAANGDWYNTLAHGSHEDDAAEILDYLLTFNDVWIAPSDEIYSYLLIRELAQIEGSASLTSRATASDLAKANNGAQRRRH